MIIAWYPGAGGNRFYKWLQGQREFESNQVYDRTNPFQIFSNRYPVDKKQVIQQPVIFTHCVNYELILQCWPDHDTVYFVQASRHKSLRRQWALREKFVLKNTHPVGGPFSTITWHDKYYSQYPWSTGPGTVVDSSTFLEFSKMLCDELESITCPEFDFAQQMFEQHGHTAPILDLYNQLYDNK